MSKPVELAIERVKEGLKLVANSIETDITNFKSVILPISVPLFLRFCPISVAFAD